MAETALLFWFLPSRVKYNIFLSSLNRLNIHTSLIPSTQEGIKFKGTQWVALSLNSEKKPDGRMLSRFGFL